jgi:uncharacterized protein YndB with AHSA1/START domain
MDTPFVAEHIYDSPINRVWSALTQKNEMREWYFPQIKNFEPVVGFEFDFENDGSPYQKDWRVTQVIHGKKLAHSWTYRGYTGSSEVTFEVVEETPKTKLKLIHSGLASFPRDPHFARDRFESGWQRILGENLKSHLEKYQPTT